MARGGLSPAPAALALYAGLATAHASLLRLPYYWDEAGYFVPAGLDFFRHGWWVPRTTLANGHPPLLSLFLAAAWSLGGFHPLVTRLAMLVWAAALLAGVYRLARQRLDPRGAALAALLTGLAPLVFAQSTLAQLDLPVAALVIWALVCFPRRMAACAVLLAAACLTKDTAAIVPAALLLVALGQGQGRRSAWLLLPLGALAAWFACYHHVTGYWFGNPQYFAYNVGQAAFSPARIAASLLRRLWQLTMYDGTGALTALALLGWWRQHRARRPTAQAAAPFPPDWAAVIAVYLLFHAVVGGAVLARYLLPALALYFIGATEQVLKLRWSAAALTAVAALLVLSWFWNPPYPFPYEDNLAYARFIRLHQAAAAALVAHPPAGPVWTAWPATEELTRPEIGYVSRPLPVHALDDFSRASLAAVPGPPDLLYLYSRQYQPLHDWAALWPRIQAWEDRIFHTAEQAPQSLWIQRLQLVPTFQAAAGGQWVTLAAPSPLFVAQGFDRVQLGRFHRREHAEKHPDGDRNAKAQPHRP